MIGVVLAAGMSSRFGQSKLSYVLGDKPLIHYVLDSLYQFMEVNVIVGHYENEPWCLEVRKLDAGMRAWAAKPGEYYMQTTGEREMNKKTRFYVTSAPIAVGSRASTCSRGWRKCVLVAFANMASASSWAFCTAFSLSLWAFLRIASASC